MAEQRGSLCAGRWCGWGRCDGRLGSDSGLCGQARDLCSATGVLSCQPPGCAAEGRGLAGWRRAHDLFHYAYQRTEAWLAIPWGQRAWRTSAAGTRPFGSIFEPNSTVFGLIVGLFVAGVGRDRWCGIDELCFKNEELCIKITQKRGILYQHHTKTRNCVLCMMNYAWSKIVNSLTGKYCEFQNMCRLFFDYFY